jgi:hypothetical protein
MAESVSFYVTDDAPAPAPLEAVTVHVYSADGKDIIATGETDADGLAVILLDADQYWVRFWLSGYGFRSKMLVDVSETLPNKFDIRGRDLRLRAPSIDSSLCRISGTLVNILGAPVPGVTLGVSISGNRRIIDGRIIVGSDLSVQSDGNGAVSFDLLRLGLYDVRLPGVIETEEFEEQSIVRVLVPDASGVEVTELLWPDIRAVQWSVSELALDVDASDTVAVQVELTNGLLTPIDYGTEIATITKYVSISCEDENVAQFTFDSSTGVITITGRSAGTTQLVATRVPDCVKERFPETVDAFESLTITVT